MGNDQKTQKAASWEKISVEEGKFNDEVMLKYNDGEIIQGVIICNLKSYFVIRLTKQTRGYYSKQPGAEVYIRKELIIKIGRKVKGLREKFNDAAK